MPRKGSYPRLSWLTRPIMVVLVILAHATTLFGVPVREAAPAKSAVPFPCQQHRCGCSSAEQCWRSCCCMSLQQKLAWAKANSVIPPDYVLAEVATSVKQQSVAKSECRCCCEAAESSCPTSEDATSPAVCAEQDDEVRWLITIEALKCRGLFVQWLLASAVLPPPPVVSLPVEVAVNPLFAVAAPLAESVVQVPDIPPPRI